MYTVCNEHPSVFYELPMFPLHFLASQGLTLAELIAASIHLQPLPPLNGLQSIPGGTKVSVYIHYVCTLPSRHKCASPRLLCLSPVLLSCFLCVVLFNFAPSDFGLLRVPQCTLHPDFTTEKCTHGHTFILTLPSLQPRQDDISPTSHRTGLASLCYLK